MIHESSDSLSEIKSPQITKVLVKKNLIKKHICLLQIGCSFVLLQNGANVITNWGKSVITNWGSYYSLEQLLLQKRAYTTNWGKIYCKL